MDLSCFVRFCQVLSKQVAHVCSGGINGIDAECIVTHNEVIHWEGETQSCRFPDGVTVEWFIDADAQSRPNFSRAG